MGFYIRRGVKTEAPVGANSILKFKQMPTGCAFRAPCSRGNYSVCGAGSAGPGAAARNLHRWLQVSRVAAADRAHAAIACTIPDSSIDPKMPATIPVMRPWQLQQLQGGGFSWRFWWGYGGIKQALLPINSCEI